MPAATLDDLYFNWLVSQVGPVKPRSRTRTHWKLLEQFHETIFVAIVPHDENRLEDARDLRYEFLADNESVQGDPDWTRSPCTMLELFIVLSRQLAFELDDSAVIWFWHLVEVLDLEGFNDHYYTKAAREAIDQTLTRVIWRHYEPDGTGGLFPLRNPSRDQRDVELWYQLNAYLLEQF